jgi:hypothetical protein
MTVSKPMMARILNKDREKFKEISEKLIALFPDQRGSYTQSNLIKEQLRKMYHIEKTKSN